MLLGERVHPRAGGEVVGRLGAAVQHDDQGHRLPAIAAGDVELVGAASGLVAVGGCQETGRRPARRRVRAAESVWAAPPVPGSDRPRLIRSRKPRSASGRCGRAVPGAPLVGRLLAPVPDACPAGGDGCGSRQLDRVRRQVDDARAASGRRVRGRRPSGRTQCPAPSRLRSRRCRSAVASVSRPARVRRVASSMSECSASFMSGASCGSARGQASAREPDPSCVEDVVGGLSCGGAPSRQLREGGAKAPGQRMRSARAALTAGLACSAPSTTIEAIVARASSGVTSWAMLARPSTWMSSVWPAARTASRSSRL